VSNVRYLPNADMPADVVLDGAKDQELDACLVIGTGDEGTYIGSTTADITKAMWLLERARHHLMMIADEAGLL
jgi:hypothetical protein